MGFTVSASRTVVVLLPGDKLSLDPDVVVGEFAHLGIVDTNNLGLFVATKTEERNVVHDPQNNGLRKEHRTIRRFNTRGREKPTHGHDEGVGKAGYRICQLNSELSVVVIEPAARNRRDAIGTRDTCLSKKTSQHVANYSTNSVRGEDLLFIG
jgi:hypothetical protein